MTEERRVNQRRCVKILFLQDKSGLPGLHVVWRDFQPNIFNMCTVKSSVLSCMHCCFWSADDTVGHISWKHCKCGTVLWWLTLEGLGFASMSLGEVFKCGVCVRSPCLHRFSLHSSYFPQSKDMHVGLPGHFKSAIIGCDCEWLADLRVGPAVDLVFLPFQFRLSGSMV